MSPDFRDFTPDPRDAVLLRSRRQTIVWYVLVLWRPVGAVVALAVATVAVSRYGHDVTSLFRSAPHQGARK